MKLPYLNRILNDGWEGRRNSAPQLNVWKEKLHFFGIYQGRFLDSLLNLFSQEQKTKKLKWKTQLTWVKLIYYLVVKSTLAGSSAYPNI